jgi:acetyl-CoA carboxylase biotin carboxyl carrier protein
MDLTEDDVMQILQFMAASDFEQLRLEMGDLKIVVNKRVGPSSGVEPVDVLTAPKSQEAQDIYERQGRPEADTPANGLVPIQAPILGIFYTAPQPGAPPFVEVGSVVGDDTTVCIIEVMKLFTAIKAGRRGRIARVCAENGQLVEYDQTLFFVELETGE